MNNLTILFTDHIFVLVTNSFTGPFWPFSFKNFHQTKHDVEGLEDKTAIIHIVFMAGLLLSEHVLHTCIFFLTSVLCFAAWSNHLNS